MEKLDVCIPSLEPLTEDCVQMVEKYIPVNRILTTSVKGRGVARQELFGRVETDWFVSLDSDISLGPTWFDSLSRAWRRVDPKTAIIYGTHSEGKEIRCLLQDSLILKESLRGLKIPFYLHVHEDSFVHRFLLNRSWNVQPVKADFRHDQRDRDYYEEYRLIGLTKKRLGLTNGKTVIKRVAESPYFFARSLYKTRNMKTAERRFFEHILYARGYFSDHIPLRLQLSKKLHIPVYGFSNWTFALWNPSGYKVSRDFDPITPFPKSLPKQFIGDWQKSGTERGITTMRHKPTGFVLTMHDFYWKLAIWEWYLERTWDRFYLPSFSLRGKTVLDVGAGEGETAAYYLSKGAEKVIAVEPNLEMLPLLRRNVEENSWNVEIVDECFTTDLLKKPYDWAKIDCEGCESLLLTVSSDFGPAFIETHSAEVHEALKAGFLMKELTPFGGAIGMLRTEGPTTGADER